MSLDQFVPDELLSLINSVDRLGNKKNGGWVYFNKVEEDLGGTLKDFEISYKVRRVYKDYFKQSREENTCLKDEARRFRDQESRLNDNSHKSHEISSAIFKYIENIRPTVLKVTKIEQLKAREKQEDGLSYYVHTLELEDSEKDELDYPIPIDTPVRIQYTTSDEKKGSAKGSIVGQGSEDTLLYFVSLDDIVPSDCIRYRMIVDNAFLYKQLASVIESIRGRNSIFDLLESGEQRPENQNSYKSNDISDYLLNDKTTIWAKFVWGPPGTGKTFAIADYLIKLISHKPNMNILVVTPTNQAIDNVVLQLFNQKKPDSTIDKLIGLRKVLRYGFTKDFSILQNHLIQGPEIYDRNVEAIKCLTEKLNLARLNNESAEQVAHFKAELIQMQIQHKEAVKDHASIAQIIFTTTTQSFLNKSPIKNRRWDVVIIDEASMVPAAYCYYISSIVDKHLLIVGDPLQLNPVFNDLQISDETVLQSWLGNDIFTKCGIYKSSRDGELPLIERRTNIIQINSQYRCIPEIWKNVKSLYPPMHDLTGNHKNVIHMEPFTDQNVVILDTSLIKDGITNQTQFNSSGSRSNEYSAGLTIRHAISMIENNKEDFLGAKSNLRISIITPYRAQAQKLKSLLSPYDDIMHTENDGLRNLMNVIKIGTIHQFQGDESDIVFIDLVESNRNKTIGKILLGDQGQRLINVAATRAKCKLIIVMNRSHFFQRGVETYNPLLFQIMTTAEVLEIRDDPSLFEDRMSDTKYEKAFRDEFLRQHEFHKTHGSIYPMFTQQFDILDDSGRIITRPDFAFPEEKRAIFIDGKSVHIFNIENYISDCGKRSKIKEMGWKSEVYLNTVITNNVGNKVKEFFRLLKPLPEFTLCEQASKDTFIRPTEKLRQQMLFDF